MATRKITISLPEDLVEAVTDVFAEDGTPLKTLVASAAEQELRRRIGLKMIARWEAEHGPFTAEELADARARMAEADAEALGLSGQAAA